MGVATATVTSSRLGLGRAALLIAASLALHAFVLSVMRDRLVVPAFDAEPTQRTIDAALITETPPAPSPPPKRVAPRRPRPKPVAPPPPAPAPMPEPAAAPEPPPVVAAANDDSPGPGETPG